MGFLTPGVVAFVTAAATATTTIIQLKKASDDKKDARQTALQLLADESRRASIIRNRASKSQLRRSAGSGQGGTILSGSGDSQGEIGRNILLGQ